MKRSLIHNRFLLPFIFAIIGFLFTTKTWIKTLDNLSPYEGLAVYYMLLTIVLVALQYAGLVIGNVVFDNWRHTFGSLLVIFSFFIVVDWESCYMNVVTKGHCDEKNVSTIYFASEDGAVYDLWNKAFPNKHETSRILTYVVTPFVLCTIGLLFITSKEKIKL